MRHGGVIILGVIALNLPCNAHIQNTAFENKMEVRSTQRDDSETGLFEKVALPNYETRDLSTDSTVPTVAPWWNVLRNGPGSQATTQAPFQQPTTRKPTKMPITKAPLTPRQTNTFTTKAPSVPAPQYLPPFFTFPPVAKPVTGPTSSPIKAPVAKPTKAPTKAPVAKPTHAPTKVPLVKPISAPTMAPVAKPTSAPIKAPHVKPTNAPTKAPVVKPTGAPIHAPVVKPTSAPIIKPSSSPIKAPILKPTSVPIKAPISKPTGAPNKAPISSITGAPVKITSSPSEKPSFLPATPPTGALPSPGRSPSSAPAQPTVQGTPVDVVIKNINIVFSNVSQLSDAETVQFELVTDTWFNEFYATMRRRVLRNSRGLQRDLVKNMNSTIMFQKQQVISGNNTITYDQRLNYTALPGASSSSEYVTLPFPDMKANTDYRNRLMTNITAFAKVGAPIMIPIIGDMSAPSPVPSSDSKSLSSGAIGGIVVAAVAVFGIIGYIAYVNVKKKELARASPNAVAALTASSKGDLHAQQQETSAPIADDRINNRVVGETSTLGGQDSASYKDDAASYKDDNASYAGKSVDTSDFDYSKVGTGSRSNIGAGATISVGDMSGDMGNLSGDDEGTSKSGAKYADSDVQIEDDQFVIYAPAGKLGLVVDNPDDGAPMIHAIKDDSVLIDQVKVGDRLVGVDEVDVRSLSPIKVSKLISKRSTNPLRKLTLTRAKADLEDDGNQSQIDADTMGIVEQSDDDTSHVGSMSRLSGEEDPMDANASVDFPDDGSSQVDAMSQPSNGLASQDFVSQEFTDTVAMDAARPTGVGEKTDEVQGRNRADP